LTFIKKYDIILKKTIFKKPLTFIKKYDIIYIEKMRALRLSKVYSLAALLLIVSKKNPKEWKELQKFFSEANSIPREAK